MADDELHQGDKLNWMTSIVTTGHPSVIAGYSRPLYRLWQAEIFKSKKLLHRQPHKVENIIAYKLCRQGDI